MNSSRPSVLLVAAAALLYTLPVIAQIPPGNNRADAPTANLLTPEQIDAQWIAATSKYDGERKRLLVDVDKTVAAGPFRNDWPRRRAYQAPGQACRPICIRLPHRLALRTQELS